MAAAREAAQAETNKFEMLCDGVLNSIALVQSALAEVSVFSSNGCNTILKFASVVYLFVCLNDFPIKGAGQLPQMTRGYKPQAGNSHYS